MSTSCRPSVSILPSGEDISPFAKCYDTSPAAIHRQGNNDVFVSGKIMGLMQSEAILRIRSIIVAINVAPSFMIRDYLAMKEHALSTSVEKSE